MDNNQPYNNFDEQFNDLPLPGEEQSWQQMKELLDEDDKNRKPVVPVFLKSCAGWGLALLIIGAASWFLVKPQRWWQQKDTGAQTTTQQKQNSPSENNIPVPVEKGMAQPSKTTDLVTERQQTTDLPVNSAEEKKTGDAPMTANSPVESKAGVSSSSSRDLNSGNSSIKKNQSKPKTVAANLPAAKQDSGLPGDRKAGGLEKPALASTVIAAPNKTEITAPEKSGTELSQSSRPNTNKTTGENLILKDSASKIAIEVRDSAAIRPNAVAPDSSVVQKENEKIKKTKWIVSAGLGLQQQIPLGGQQAVPYDYYGRTGSLSDYIPSVYLRLENGKKWFVQGEFRYGAPQTLADFQYSRLTKLDSQNLTVTTFRLKKTYYHQFPFSFNYHVIPKLSVGVGGIFSRFHGAVSEKEVKQTDLQTQVEKMSREIVNIQHFNDSFLYKTQVHAMFQTEYHWKRFDFGLRYTKDIQPYIKYTQPDGHIDVKKNQTFQLLVRFRIWDSKKKFNG